MTSKINENIVDNSEKRIEQIRKILEETVEHLKILCNISLLTRHNGRILYRFLPGKEAEYVLEILRKFEKLKRTTVEHDVEDVIDSCVNIYRKDSCSDLDFSKIVESILNSKCIKKFLRKVDKPCEPSMEKFISYIKQLSEIVDRNLKVTPMDELKIEGELKQAFAENDFLKNRIQELEETLAQQQLQFDNEHERYEMLNRNLTETIEKFEEKYNFDVQQLTYESENSMMQLTLEAEKVLSQLQEEIEKSQRQYADTIEKHQKDEKQQRIALSKIETQLNNWVEKYDKDMMEKQADLEVLQNEYNAEMDQVHELEKKLERQNILYRKLMQDKHDEEERIIINFIQNCAARRIQRAWRAYRARQKAKQAKKKKGKKGEKGKKGKKSKK